MLALLFGLQPKSRQSSKIFFDDSLVHGTTSLDSLSVVVCNVCPPIRLGLDIAENHVFDGGWHARNLPRDVCLPASKSFA